MDLVIVQLIEYAIWGAIVVALGILALVAAGAVYEGRTQPTLWQFGTPARREDASGWPDDVRRVDDIYDDIADTDDFADDAENDAATQPERRRRAA